MPFSFSHPVLGHNNDIEGSFTPEYTWRYIKEKDIISIATNRLNINNKYLKNLVINNQAHVSIKIYCSSSLMTWSEKVKLNEPIEIPINQINNDIEVSYFIKASNNLKEYYDKSFNDDYDVKITTIKKNDILGISDKKSIFIGFLYESHSVRGMFKIEPYKGRHITYDADQNQIEILYPDQSKYKLPKFHKTFWNISKSNFILSFLYPCLIDILHTSKDEADYQDYLWYKKFEDITGKKIEDEEPSEIAWEFILKLNKNKSILQSSIKEIKKNGS